jgi:exportin-1
MTDKIPPILGAVFECTLGMITKNFEDYPVHRQHFFDLIRAINHHCFPGTPPVPLFFFFFYVDRGWLTHVVRSSVFPNAAFFMIPAPTFKIIIDSVVWAFKHTMRNIAETGLNILLEMWQNIEKANAEVAQSTSTRVHAFRVSWRERLTKMLFWRVQASTRPISCRSFTTSSSC